MNAELIALGSQARQEWPEQGEWIYEDWLRLPDDGFRYKVAVADVFSR